MISKKEWKGAKWELFVTDNEVIEGQEKLYYIRDVKFYEYRVVRAVISSKPDGMRNPEEMVLLSSKSYILKKLWIDIKEEIGGPEHWMKDREELNLPPGIMR
jgi:hypothetical protein